MDGEGDRLVHSALLERGPESGILTAIYLEYGHAAHSQSAREIYFLFDRISIAPRHHTE